MAPFNGTTSRLSRSSTTSPQVEPSVCKTRFRSSGDEQLGIKLVIFLIAMVEMKRRLKVKEGMRFFLRKEIINKNLLFMERNNLGIWSLKHKRNYVSGWFNYIEKNWKYILKKPRWTRYFGVPCLSRVCEIRIKFFFRVFKTVFVTDGLLEPIRSNHVDIYGR